MEESIIQDIALTSNQYYRNDPNYRQSGVNLNLSKEQVEEFIKCKDDIIYFTQKYAYIVDPENGLEIIKLYDYQKDVLRHIERERFSILLMPRQSAKTTSSALYICHYLIFNSDKTTAILANKQKISQEIFERVLLTLSKVPQFLKPGVVKLNALSLELDNGSKLHCAATSASAIRGLSVNCLLIDETAFIAKNIWEEFFNSSYPTISKAPDSKILLSSTPNGMNHFYTLWEEAVKGRNSFKPFTISWDQVPGRDEQFKIKTISDIGIERWQQEYEMAFQAASNCLFTTESLRQIQYKTPVQIEMEGCLRIYEGALKDTMYCIAVDVSDGVGKDYSTVSVIKCGKQYNEQVAVYRNNQIETNLLPFIIETLGKQYNNALVLVENNGSGVLVTDILHNEIQYENFYHEDMTGKRLGIRTTKSVKYHGTQTLKADIEKRYNGGIIINDYNTVKELSVFEKKGNSYQAQSGHNDDLVMNLVLFCYFKNSTYYKETLGRDVAFVKQLEERRLKEILKENWLPMASSRDGITTSVGGHGTYKKEYTQSEIEEIFDSVNDFEDDH
jgi:hypothetical protein